ncbi:hypothetical protein [Caldivirga maquilingensis]|uniref:Uncharacterized protein n=1 Tax=Caldivirga maquilingensis (strain ATCC 700844 / DSM 13496 / JCM 10307 / IC-167) TaxID=397948 RepID=A8ME98_CALMQ|nr:hypothetical protein [Caldivirga maquilingensis]ABW02104.1 hypothetical protein Cmaq_1277 [Caldivirga maquilingensis IC-167]
MINGVITLTRSRRFRSVDFNINGILVSGMMIGKAYSGLIAVKGSLGVLSSDEARELVQHWDKVTNLIIRVTGSNFYTFSGPFQANVNTIKFNVYFDVFKNVEVTITPNYLQLTLPDSRRRFRSRGELLSRLVKSTLNILSKYTEAH